MLNKLKEMLGFGLKSNAESKKFSILVVEDTDVDRALIEKILLKNGFKVDVAENGRIGLEKALAGSYHLIFLDCDMPEMKGQEVCRQLKLNDKTEKIPVIFLTSDDTPKNIVDCYELDAENYLSKPVNPKILLNYVQEILLSKKSL